MSKGWLPTGRLALRAFAAQHVAWEQTWIEKAAGDLPELFETIAKTFESAKPKITKLLEEHERERERQRKESEALHERWRREEEERRRREAEAARLKELEQHVTAWRQARDLRAYVAEAKQLIADAECKITRGSSLEKWLDGALAHADEIDPLGGLRADIRKLTAEREAQVAAGAHAAEWNAAEAGSIAAPDPSARPGVRK